MLESTSTLRKMSRQELLEMLVEQSKNTDEAVARKEELEALLAEKDEEIVQLQQKLQKYSKRVRTLKDKLDSERMIRLHSLAESKTISEASRYMDQILEDTRVANVMYQKLIRRISEEAKKHE